MAATGRLYYLIGASGAGKDSLIRYARERIGDAPVVFAHRYITRPVELAGENHIALTAREFEQRLACGCFAMHWEGNGLQYGIGVELGFWLEQGLSVVVNGSRAYLDEAIHRFPDLQPVLIQVSARQLMERLQARGRENIEQIRARAERANELSHLSHPRLHVINNDGALAQAGETLLELLRAETLAEQW